MFDLHGKVAVVTGGTGVLGSSMCRDLAKAGASVAVLGTTQEKTDRLAGEIADAGGQAVGVQVNVLDKDSLHNARERIMAQYGKIDILINGAGGNKPEGTTSVDRSFFDLHEEALDWVFDLNYMGTVLACQTFGKSMAERGEGVILNVSSMASTRPMTRVIAYASAKAAINNLTYWLAVHFAKEYSPNIRVNAIAPGFFMTEQNRFLLTNADSGELTQRGQQIIDHTPMGRFGDPQDLTGAMLWLVSDASRFVTGIVVPVDGGFSAYSGV
ncbi:MAG: SDR family oxidoreductase [Anaerolineae bacterium]